jgi:hypothetical protein
MRKNHFHFLTQHYLRCEGIFIKTEKGRKTEWISFFRVLFSRLFSNLGWLFFAAYVLCGGGGGCSQNISDFDLASAF